MARSLERRWEEALRQQRELQEEWDRLAREQPPHLSPAERTRILALASDITTLWTSVETTAVDRKEILRFLVERVVVRIRSETPTTEVSITWRGGCVTEHVIARSVSRYESLGNYPELLARIRQLRSEGRTIREVATELNAAGFRTPKSGKGFTSTSVRKLISWAGIAQKRVTS